MRSAVLQRFHRVAGQNIFWATLGLSIVDNIVTMHHVKLELVDGDHGVGLKVVVVFSAV